MLLVLTGADNVSVVSRLVPIRLVTESVWTLMLAGFWNSAARLGFASACVLAAGISFAALHRPPDVPTVVQTASVSAATINEAVNKAVALAVQKAHDDDIQMTRAALDEVDRKYAQKQQNLMVAMQSNLEYFQKTYEKNARNSYTVWPTGARQ